MAEHKGKSHHKKMAEHHKSKAEHHKEKAKHHMEMAKKAGPKSAYGSAASKKEHM